MSDLRELLRSGLFRRLFATRLIGQFGDGVFQVALAAFVVFSPQKEATAAEVAKAFALLLVPFTVIGPFAGVFLDRWRRRQVLLYANVMRAGIVLIVAAQVLAGHSGILFYASALGVLSCNRFILAGLSAALPQAVDNKRLVVANAVSPTAGTLAATLGGSVGVVVRALVGSGDRANALILVVAAVLYMAGGLVARTMKRDSLGPDQSPGTSTWSELKVVARGLVEGLEHLKERKPAAAALAAITANRFCYGLTTIMVLLLFRNTFNDPQDTNAGLRGFGTAVAVSGFGYFIAAFASPIILRHVRFSTWITVCMIGSGVALAASAGWWRVVPLLIGALVLGFLAQGQKICTDTTVQRNVEDSYRGRVFSLYDMLFNGAFVAAAAVAAATLPASGKSTALLYATVAVYLVTGIAYAWFRAASRSAHHDRSSVSAVS
ncbi:major facilitator superfamily MFS_1 [Catenulispora acidiphila DSM 44928]|uniref:Major facilitator superfamily MFS_1 n=1 Tax=Catenulispora acidiphila (strain DSM 44928 / JCM 14897 / NBRC 102108 / NRRL B-24433 / ID139908) TaxID=479433 RepID=C7Q5N7_CATAD|nr:MFS transporter [Catenulispora acidiphila]ACU77848.1 major facilitator superfamily MFS_1 [Catenulispora acidiphila DSM 44928]